MPITWPALWNQCVGAELAAQTLGVGDAALLESPLLGLIASRQCPGRVLLEALDRVPEWVKTGRVIVSGFHSPLEQQVLRSLLRRNGRAVKVLARGFGSEDGDYRPSSEEREPIATGRLLVISAVAPHITRITRATALSRNSLVLALASEVVVPYLAAGSPLEELVRTHQGHRG